MKRLAGRVARDVSPWERSSRRTSARIPSWLARATECCTPAGRVIPAGRAHRRQGAAPGRAPGWAACAASRAAGSLPKGASYGEMAVAPVMARRPSPRAVSGRRCRSPGAVRARSHAAGLRQQRDQGAGRGAPSAQRCGSPPGGPCPGPRPSACTSCSAGRARRRLRGRASWSRPG